MLAQKIIFAILAVSAAAQEPLLTDPFNDRMDPNFGGQQSLVDGDMTSLRNLENDQILPATPVDGMSNLDDSLMRERYMGADLDRSMQYREGRFDDPLYSRNDQGLSGMIDQQRMSSLSLPNNLDIGRMRIPNDELDMYRLGQPSNDVLDNFRDVRSDQRLSGFVDQQDITTADPFRYVDDRQTSRLGSGAFDSQLNNLDLGNEADLLRLADEQRMSTMNALNNLESMQMSPFSSPTVDSSQNYENFGYDQFLSGSFYQPLINAIQSLSGIVRQQMAQANSDILPNQDIYSRYDQFRNPTMNENAGILPNVLRGFSPDREDPLLDRRYMPSDSLSSQYFSNSQRYPSTLFDDLGLESRRFNRMDPFTDDMSVGGLSGFPTSGFENDMQLGRRESILDSSDSQMSLGRGYDMSRTIMNRIADNMERLRSLSNDRQIDPMLSRLDAGRRDVFEDSMDRISLTPQSRRMEGNMALERRTAELF
ncbi:uncharacterized protein LOC134266855 [Saccostrea cucullata]|uniref:uncharacterized protein LOC134266855 n=1 Tax=Saccostrea cuccullata TaxID=36930 RepID=UPI002ED1D0D1